MAPLTGILDHHEDRGLHKEAEPRVISFNPDLGQGTPMPYIYISHMYMSHI